MSLAPNIRINASVPFPSLVQASGPITLVKQNGVWTIGFSINAVQAQNPPPQTAWPTDSVLAYDSVAKQLIQVSLGSIQQRIGRVQLVLQGVNFNAANTDNPFNMIGVGPSLRYAIESLIINKASASLTTATCGLFTGAGATGTAIVTSGSAITVNTAAGDTNNNMQSFTINNKDTEAYDLTPIYFRVQNAQGAPATADVILTVRNLS